MIRAGIIGGSGYTGGELIRLLLNHPGAEIAFVYSSSRAGQEVHKAHADLLGYTKLCFSGQPDPEVDVVFLCLGHGNSRSFLEQHQFGKTTRIIDLSSDFRLQKDTAFKDLQFVYGLPELHGRAIETSQAVANPGCFATAIQLALLPLAQEGCLDSEVHINAVTGSTGAGAANSETSHFSWRNNNLSWYKPFTHQHMEEILENLSSLQPKPGKLYLLPGRGNYTRGIFATAYTRYEGSEKEAISLFHDYYRSAAFTKLALEPVTLKQVVNTNQCHLHLHKHEDMLLITSVIDNLLKGASGQAVQNMNLMFGRDEREGLLLKAGVY